MHNLITKIGRKLTKLRLQPIRVFCFHQVSDVFDPSTMWKCDWMQIDSFQRTINALQMDGVKFISLPEAYDKIKNDIFRSSKYAVLTADDGWASLTNIIPWLVEQNIPLTLFLNSAYLDGKHFQERETEKLLTENDIKLLVNKYPNHLTVASHGRIHIDTRKLSESEFMGDVIEAEKNLSQLPNKISFYAFTYGRFKPEYIQILQKQELIPVLMDGKCNIDDSTIIHRENIENVAKYLQKSIKIKK